MSELTKGKRPLRRYFSNSTSDFCSKDGIPKGKDCLPSINFIQFSGFLAVFREGNPPQSTQGRDKTPSTLFGTEGISI